MVRRIEFILSDEDADRLRELVPELAVGWETRRGVVRARRWFWTVLGLGAAVIAALAGLMVWTGPGAP